MTIFHFFLFIQFFIFFQTFNNSPLLPTTQGGSYYYLQSLDKETEPPPQKQTRSSNRKQEDRKQRPVLIKSLFHILTVTFLFSSDLFCFHLKQFPKDTMIIRIVCLYQGMSTVKQNQMHISGLGMDCKAFNFVPFTKIRFHSSHFSWMSLV